MDLGPTFKALRQQKGLSLAQASHNVLSISQLSRFENQQSSITAEALLGCLKNLHLTLGEFQRTLEAKTQLEQNILQKKIDMMLAQHDFAAMAEYGAELLAQKPTPNSWQQREYFRIQALLTLNAPTLAADSPGEKFLGQRDLEKYFQTIEEWSVSEINSFLYIFELLSLPAVQLNAPVLLRKIQQLNQPNVYAYFLLSLFSYYVHYQELAAAEEVLRQTEKNLPQQKDAWVSIIAIFQRGIWHQIHGRLPLAQEKYDTALSLCHILQQEELAQHLRASRKRWQRYPEFIELVSYVEYLPI